jgi:hypothetical protein
MPDRARRAGVGRLRRQRGRRFGRLRVARRVLVRATMKHLTSTTIWSASALAALLAAAACSKTETKTSGAGASPTSPSRAASPAGGPDFAAWDPAGKANAWQGSWLVKDNGTIQAWTITGDQVQTWDGTTEKAYTLKVTSPCTAQLVTAGGVGMMYTFAAVDGKLQKREAAGYRKGAAALFCDGGGDVYVVDAGGACTRWEGNFGEFKQTTDGVCGFKAGAKGEVFFHEGPQRRRVRGPRRRHPGPQLVRDRSRAG